MVNLKEQIKKVNEVLNAKGIEALQKYDTGSFVAVGYRPQYIIDAVNEVIGQGNWKHSLKQYKIEEVASRQGSRQVVTAEVTIQILDKGNVIFETGSQFGGGNVVKGNIGDGIKAAITDAIGKALSMLSVGSDAYCGILGKLYGEKLSLEEDIPETEAVFTKPPVTKLPKPTPTTTTTPFTKTAPKPTVTSNFKTPTPKTSKSVVNTQQELPQTSMVPPIAKPIAATAPKFNVPKFGEK